MDRLARVRPRDRHDRFRAHRHRHVPMDRDALDMTLEELYLSRPDFTSSRTSGLVLTSLVGGVDDQVIGPIPLQRPDVTSKHCLPFLFFDGSNCVLGPLLAVRRFVPRPFLAFFFGPALPNNPWIAS